MNRFKQLATALLAVLMSISVVAAASASTRVYNATTNTWEEPSSGSSGRRGSSIRKKIVDYDTKYKPGTIIVETAERRLYFVLEGGKAMKYGIGVGREGFTWAGTNKITRKAEWPGWTPPPAMRKRVPGLPAHMEGGPDNPLGARALYIGSTLYRLHGTSEPWTIGQAVSSGCIRLTNDDISDLYERVKVGARVIVKR